MAAYGERHPVLFLTPAESSALFDLLSETLRVADGLTTPPRGRPLAALRRVYHKLRKEQER